jgi:hypothetical protein
VGVPHAACAPDILVWIYILGFKDKIGCNMPKGKKSLEKKAEKAGESVVKGLRREAKKLKKQIKKEKKKIQKK